MELEGKSAIYIHGTHEEEQGRLSRLNMLTNGPFLQFLDIRDGDNVLEVGSGLGILSEEIALKFPSCLVHGVEYSVEQLTASAAWAPNLCLRQGDAHSLPFEDNQFDVVYCRYVLEHLHNPEVAVAEMFRVLKQGGKFFCQENDDSMVTFDPPCPNLEAVFDQFILEQAKAGGDGCIGRRLFGLLKRARFQNISLSLQPQLHWYDEPTYPIWLDNMAEIIRGATESIIASGKVTELELANSIAEIENLKSNIYGSALFHWNRAVGEKS